MLQVKLKSKGGPSTEGVGSKASEGGEPSRLACPDHLKVADLPVAKSIGPVKQFTVASAVKSVGRKACQEKGERVHICIRCDYPIAIYGRLIPCEHAFCLECAKSDSTCFLCDERIQKIQTYKVFEGIWICAAPQCLKSFLKKEEFDSHILRSHGDLLIPCPKKEEGNESKAASARKQTLEPTAKSELSLSSGSLQRDQHNATGFHQPADIVHNPNPFPIPLPLNHPHFGKDGIPFYGSPFQQRQESAPYGEQWQGPMMGFPPRPAVESVNFLRNNYPLPWGVGQTRGFFDPSLVGRESVDGFKNLSVSDSHGRVAGFQGNFEQNDPSKLALHPAANKDVEHLSGQHAIQPRDAMGMLPPPPPPPPPRSHPPHSSQLNRGQYFPTGGASRSAQAPGWQPEHRNYSGGGREY